MDVACTVWVTAVLLFKKATFISLFLAPLGLHCGAWAFHCSDFSCCGRWIPNSQTTRQVLSYHFPYHKKRSEILMMSMWVYGSIPLITYNQWQYYMQFQQIGVFLTEFMGCNQEPQFICFPYIVMNMNLSQLWEMVEDRGAWSATVHGVSKSLAWLSNWATTSV